MTVSARRQLGPDDNDQDATTVTVTMRSCPHRFPTSTPGLPYLCMGRGYSSLGIPTVQGETKRRGGRGGRTRQGGGREIRRRRRGKTTRRRGERMRRCRRRGELTRKRGGRKGERTTTMTTMTTGASERRGETRRRRRKRRSRGKPNREGRNDEKEDDAEKGGNDEQEERGTTMTRGETTRHEQSQLALLVSFLFTFKIIACMKAHTQGRLLLPWGKYIYFTTI